MRSLVLASALLALASTSATADNPLRGRLLIQAGAPRVEIAHETPRARVARKVQLRLVVHETAATEQPLALPPPSTDEAGPPPMMKQMRSQLYASLPSMQTASIRMTATVMAIPSADGSLVGAGVLGRF